MQFQKILIIDNFDSFTYNLVDYFKRLGCEVLVYRNNIQVEQIKDIEFDLLVLSPGPSTPSNAGNLFDIIRHFYQKKPIFGICLGLQALIEFFGGSLKLVPPHHGKADNIINDQKSIYSGLNKVVEIARYHSLAADKVPNCFEISAHSPDGTVMSVRHKQLPIEAVQFHPESVLSMRDEVGLKIIQNVIDGKIASGNIYYKKLMNKVSLDAPLETEDVESFVDYIVSDQLTEDQKLILLTSLTQKFRDPQNLLQFVAVLQARNAYEAAPEISSRGIDICGTGGSGLPRFNTSTIAGVLLSYLGLPIIKHGNKAASGRFGSFDLLEALDVPIMVEQTVLEEAFSTTNLAYLYARKTHPVVGKFASTRARIGVPTVFNVIGPILNPYNPQRQFIGTAFAQFMELIFETSILMGKNQVTVVRSDDGLDDISATTTTKVLEYKNGTREKITLRPQDFGIEPVPFEALKCDNKEDNIRIAQAMLNGDLNTEHYKLVAVNAAYIYAEYQEKMPLEEAYTLMVETMKSGALKKHLQEYTNSLSMLVEA